MSLYNRIFFNFFVINFIIQIFFSLIVPPQPNNEYIKLIALDPYKVRKSTTTAAILLPLFSNISGDVKFYAIMVAKEGYNRLQLNTRFDLKSKIWPNTSSWEEAMMNDFSITYQATEPNWNPYRR